MDKNLRKDIIKNKNKNSEWRELLKNPLNDSCIKKSNLYFIHIPKNGGSSIEKAYQDYGWGIFFPKSYIEKSYPERDLKSGGKPCSFWHDHNIIYTTKLGCSNFCVIREPISRLLSQISQMIESSVIFKPGATYSNDERSVNNIIKLLKTGVEKNQYLMDNHLRPQHHFIKHSKYLLKLDKLQEGINKLMPKYNLPVRNIQKSNTSYLKINKNLIDEKNIDWVREYYKEDFKLWNSFKNKNIIERNK
jgi:hypothetical protein